MSKLRAAIYGFAVGDALGVPYEFVSRKVMEEYPATEMIGFGTHQQEAGTWSDDTTFLLCVLENIMENGTPSNLREKMLQSYNDGYLTPHGELFDIGTTTLYGIMRWKLDGTFPKQGNGTLMRSLPYAFRKDINKSDFEMLLEHRITHKDTLCSLCSTFYIRMARALVNGADIYEAVMSAGAFIRFGCRIIDNPDAHTMYDEMLRLMRKDFSNLPMDQIRSTGYVIDTLEAVCWCLLNTDNYKDAVLKGVNLGGDTDTIGALIGGIAGIIYGYEAIPSDWLDKLQNKDLIEELVKRAEEHEEFVI